MENQAIVHLIQLKKKCIAAVVTQREMAKWEIKMRSTLKIAMLLILLKRIKKIRKKTKRRNVKMKRIRLSKI
jgi:hypothetical protein